MAKENNALLVFDFDNTVTNEHMHNAFSKLGKGDFNSTQSNAVTDDNIRRFIETTGGMKNEENLKSVLQFAISKGIEVNIASFTRYPNAVKRVVENHLGLSKEQADSVSVFSGFPQDYDTRLQGSVEKQKSEVGKNLHICKAIVEYKGKHGQLPKTVMLVDDDTTNIEKIKNFVELMSTREGWLKGNGLSIEDIDNIKFEDAEVLDKDASYLERVQEFVYANLVQEPIYQNLQKQLSEEKSPSFKSENSNVEAKPPLPLSKEAIDVICSLFKEKVISAIRERGDEVTENGENEFTIESADHYGDYSKITVDSRTQIMAKVEEKKKEIKDFASNYKGEDPQLSKKISELLNVNLQKTDINSNYVTINQSEGQQAAASSIRYIKVTQDKNIGSNPTGIDKREKGKKTDLGSKILSYIPGKTAFSKIKETQELSKRDIEVSDPNHSSKSHVTSEDEPKAKSQVEAELKRRANAASQEQSAERQIRRYR